MYDEGFALVAYIDGGGRYLPLHGKRHHYLGCSGAAASAGRLGWRPGPMGPGDEQKPRCGRCLQMRVVREALGV
jgi:hypothetical protein